MIWDLPVGRLGFIGLRLRVSGFRVSLRGSGFGVDPYSV